MNIPYVNLDVVTVEVTLRALVYGIHVMRWRWPPGGARARARKNSTVGGHEWQGNERQIPTRSRTIGLFLSDAVTIHEVFVRQGHNRGVAGHGRGHGPWAQPAAPGAAYQLQV
jgi:hypothetical protein